MSDQRPLPFDIDAEEAVIGSLILDPEAMPAVLPFLSPAAPSLDFYREKHQWMFEALLAMHEQGIGLDPITLCDELERRGKLGEIGGVAAVSHLMMQVPTAIHAVHYAKIVERHAVHRRLIHAAERITKVAYEGTTTPAESLALAEAELMRVGGAKSTDYLERLSDVLGEFYERAESIFLGNGAVGLPSGFDDLDRLLGGFGKGDLIILAARPSIGKTSLALSMARQMAGAGARSYYASLEMGASQLVQRLVSAESGIDVQRLRAGPLYESDLDTLAACIERLRSLPLRFDGRAALSLPELRTTLRQIQARDGLDVVFVDYLGLLSSGRRTGNRVEEISVITRFLKELARELDVPVIALSQLSRGVESRQDKRPMLSDLRDSGSVEQDADVVMFIYRDEVYNPNTDRPSVAEVIVAKHRNGPTGTVDLRFSRETARFSGLESYRHEAAPMGAPVDDDIIF